MKIESLIETKDNLFVRRDIYVSHKQFTDENILDAVKEAMTQHEYNRKQIDYLYNYSKGKQPILDRFKAIRPEIKNTIVENHALEIKNFKTGFLFGEPVQYISRGDEDIDMADNKQEDKGIVYLNQLMFNDDKPAKDVELGDWIFTCGVGYRMCLQAEDDRDVFETYILDPRTTFVVKSNDYKKKPILGVTFSDNLDENKHLKYRQIDVYSEDHYWFLEEKNGKYKILKSIHRAYKGIPIFEYCNNSAKMGSFEIVIGLCDALNNITSNRIDGIEQFIQSLIWFNNCEINEEEYEQLKKQGAIQTTSEAGKQASIKILTEQLDQSQTQITKDDIYETMLIIAGVPDRQASAGGNTGQALIIGQGWQMAESHAKAFELKFNDPEKQFLRYVLSICKNNQFVPNELKKLEISCVEVKFTRNRTDNILTKTQALSTMLNSGIHPKTAIATCGLFSDPQQVWADSIEYLKKYLPEDNGIVKALEAINQRQSSEQ